MKKFILKIVLFSFLVFSVAIGLYCYWYIKKQKEQVKISKHNIIIGDSNTRWSINDSILSGYANYSTGGETYLFALTKLRILNKSNKIDTLLLSLSPHNVINSKWWNDKADTPLQNRMPAFYQNFSEEDHLNLMKETPKNYIISICKIGKTELKEIFAPLIKKEKPMFRFGSYLPAEGKDTESKDDLNEYKKPVIQNIEVEYLKKIIEECRSNNTHLILIQPPKNYLHPNYANYNYKEFYDLYRKEYGNIDFLDFSHLPLPKNSYWDLIHVNVVGAEYFSNFLQNKGIKNLLNSSYNIKNDYR